MMENSMRTLAKAASLVWIAFVGYPSSSSAQPTPSATSICDLPQYRGTATYNKYCVPSASPPSHTQETAPAPPPGQAEAHDLNQKGIDAYNSGDYDSAAKYFQEALARLPGDSTIQQNLQTVKDQIAATKQKSEKEFKQGKLRALGQMKGISNRGDFDSASSLKGVGSTDAGLKGVPPSGDSSGLKPLPDVSTAAHVVDASTVPAGLKGAVADSPSDKNVVRGSFGDNVAKPELTLVSVTPPGSDIKAGDQLLGAAATARAREDLTINYDTGGAKSAGSLRVPTHPSIDPATSSTKFKDNPAMISALKRLGDLQAMRSHLDAEMKQLTAERDLENDPRKMAELTIRVNRKNHEYQVTLKAITDEEQTVRTLHRSIETKVGKGPEPPAAPLAAAKD
jgi:hypothetical protein